MDSVFLSYRQTDDTQKERVRTFAERLKGCGISVVLDQFYLKDNPGGPPDGWPKWSSDQALNTKRVLIIGNKEWFECFDGAQPQGTGLGVACEAGDIRQRLYKCAGKNEEIRVVVFDQADSAHISAHIERYHRFHADDDFTNIVRWLGGTVPTSTPAPPALDWPDTAPALQWPVADHTAARDAFAKLITRGSPFRFLPISGISEMGKSHLTNQFLANALTIPHLTCGRFDFKGSADMDSALGAFADHLGAPVPKPGTGVSAQLAEIFNALKAKAHPTLLIFDTFEAASEAERWVKETLLLSLPRAPWLRVIIVGQKVPPSHGQAWAAVSAPPVALRAPTPEEWFEYGQPYKPGLTLDFVRQAHGHCGEKIALLAGLLGPAA